MGLITYCFKSVNIVFYEKRHNEDVKDKLRLYIALPRDVANLSGIARKYKLQT